MTKPYLCISALQSSVDVEVVLNAFAASKGQKGAQVHQPCIGFAVDRHTVAGSATHSPRKVDSLEVLRAGVQAAVANSVRAALHVDLQQRDRTVVQGSSIKEAVNCFLSCEALVAQLLSQVGGAHVIVQLNGIVRAEECKRLKSAHPQLSLVIPIGGLMLLLAEEEVAEYITKLSPIVETFLLDSSGGAGKPYTPEELRKVAALLRRYAPAATLGVSGGLSPRNIAERISELRSDADLMKHYPLGKISFDVESGVRSSVAQSAETSDADRLDPTLVREFIVRAYAALERA